MNEVLQSIKTRRSVRAYLPKQVEKEVLDQVLEAGTYAPTGSDRQSPVIVAVQDPAAVRQISQLNAAVLGGKGDPFYGAPTVLVVLADKSKSKSTYLLDGAAVLTTLVNAAHAVGLASCWVHRAKETFESEEGKALLKKWGVTGDYVGVGNVALGYAAEEPGEASPRKKGYIVRV